MKIYFQKIQERVIKTTLSIQSEISIPYSVAACRRALYEVVLATVTSPSAEWPPPTQCAVVLFSKGAQDVDFEARENLACDCSSHCIRVSAHVQQKLPTLCG